MAKVKEMVWLMLMPMSCAASVSSDTARMALPILVLLTRRVRPTMEMAVMSRVMTATPEMVRSPPK